ncbi:MAG: hypothetical protein KGJ57_21320 [Sphingomonadales bacterium]|nr:hypothetical protein [Sphingomonadales bacterium]MDE2171934.1 hypothetical protein [Sphingomonadales bacterium]
MNGHCLDRFGCVIFDPVKKAIHLFLLIGALIGLFGQEVAIATVVPVVNAPMTMQSSSDAGMPDDCMKMMARQQPTKRPCKGMTLACMAAMGCIAPMAIRSDAPVLAARQINPVPAFWPVTSILHGSNLAPDPEPPTLLG